MDKVITAQQLCDFAEAMLGQCYWYGCFSQIGTEKLYKEKLAQFPSQIGKWPKSTYTAQYGKRVMDCSGLIKAAAGTKGDPLKIPTYADIAKFDWSADAMISKCTDVVDFKNIPEIPGMLVWKKGHVGVFIKTLPDGKKLVRESAGHMKGVIESTTTAWTKAGKLPFVDYAQVPPEDKCMIEMPILNKGMKGLDEIATFQIMCNALGFRDQDGKQLVVDKSYGGRSVYVCKQVQKKAGLLETGICNQATWIAILK